MFMRKKTAASLAALTLALLALIVCALLPSCRNAGTPATTTGEPEQASDAATSDTGAAFTPVDSFRLIDDGVSMVRIVRPDLEKDSDYATMAAVKLKKEFQALTLDGTQSIGTDWTKSGEHDPEPLEILFGRTEYSEGSEDVAALKVGEFIAKAYGNKIVICSLTADGYDRAIEALMAGVRAHASVRADGEKTVYTVDIPRAELDYSAVYDSALYGLPKPEGAKFQALYLTGETGKELIYSDTSPETFAAYVEALKAAGFEAYASHDIKENRFATLFSPDLAVNVGYYAYNKYIRVIAEPYTAACRIGTEADNVFTRVTGQRIIMAGLENLDSDGSYRSNGLCMIIRLSDGRFVIVDGGFNTTDHANSIVRILKEQSKDYIGSGKITIAAWIITHSHGDHQGVLNGKNSVISKAGIKVERVITCYLSQTELVRSRAAYPSNWDETEGGGYINTYKAAENLGALQTNTHVGQVFHYADLKIEVLCTLESLAPAAMNACNSTSLIMKMTFTDPSTGAETVYMSTGDATGPEFAICNLMYGDYMKSDIVQVAHHGYTTWSNSAATIAAYKTMLPSVVLWPVGDHGYPNVADREYNVVLVNKTTNPNFKEVYIAGDLGKQTVLDMPYKAGTATVVPPAGQ
jgi:beta-lactamase superfamily II metal-dependent hydrolase